MGNSTNQQQPIQEAQRLPHEHRILTILENYSQRNIQTEHKQRPIFKKGDYQVCAQLDENNQLNGYAVMRRNMAMVFEGEFAASKRNGYGIEYEDGKVFYEGNYVNDLRDGWGKDQTYEGEFSMGQRNGWGIETEKASRFEGYWKEGKEQGMGVKFYGRVPASHCFDYALKEAIFCNFDLEVPCEIYLGQWKQGMRSGIGKLRSLDFIYVGEFQLGVFNGKGKLVKKVGTVEQGNFSNGQFIHN